MSDENVSASARHILVSFLVHHPRQCVVGWERGSLHSSDMTADFAEPRNHSIVTTPFPSQRVGSGDKTNYKPVATVWQFQSSVSLAELTPDMAKSNPITTHQDTF